MGSQTDDTCSTLKMRHKAQVAANVSARRLQATSYIRLLPHKIAWKPESAQAIAPAIMLLNKEQTWVDRTYHSYAGARRAQE